jgi:hypothetical protein
MSNDERLSPLRLDKLHSVRANATQPALQSPSIPDLSDTIPHSPLPLLGTQQGARLRELRG